MTKPQLKLVGAPASVPHPRPFQTVYYTEATSDPRPREWCAKGRAASARGAVRAAFMRVLDRRAGAALVHDESGTVIARVWRAGRSIYAVGSAVVKGGLA
jgi:hypothetical protein